ncbi:MAG: LytTR family transcriptional regulator DNA-binding domain-containing protein [Dysgonamonadaceae bacterium]|jgi:DNA-binding LytR/AlgR family response regulator|nr:LytTR family transcriptional regulator DNA-binding domain-containing protein [Dysgonamonadaceae bacterium]
MAIINRNNIVYSLLIAFSCIVYGLLQAVAFHRFVSFPFVQYALCGIFDALFLFGLTFLLWKVVKYGNFKALDFRQRFVNYFVVGLLFMAIWNGLSLLTLYTIFGESQMEEINNISYTKAILAFLIYPIIVLSFQLQLNKQQTNEPINEETDETVLETERLEKLERIVIKTGQKINVIAISEIVYFQAEGDYVRIFTDTGKFLKEDTIKFYQARLPEMEFVRVHRSYLVNVSKILRIELYEKQSQQLTLSNGDKLKISASGYKRLREVLGL